MCIYRLSPSHRPPAPTGDPLQWLPEDPSVQSRHVAVRGMLPERGLGGGGSLFAPECRDRDQTAQQHVHVQGQFGHEAHLSGLQVTQRNMSWFLLSASLV